MQGKFVLEYALFLLQNVKRQHEYDFLLHTPKKSIQIFTKGKYVYVNMLITGLESEYGDEEETLGSGGGNSKKRRRAWELWSMEDKDIFFESINECGKDFEAIQVLQISCCNRKVWGYLCDTVIADVGYLYA